jgi:polyisoprenoid-binding protein YceI
MKKGLILFAILLIGFSTMAQNMTVNIAKSELKWTGKKVTGEHWGFITLKDATLKIENNKISSGVFNIDMNTLNCKDLEDAEWNSKLVGHLRSDDFFSVDKFPIATLTITESTMFNNGEAQVKGNLTIKGITHPTSFKVKKTDKGYMATVTVDRTKYNVKYGSGKFFDNLGDNMIYDEFTLDVKIVVE